MKLKITAYEKAKLRLECAKSCIMTGSRLSLTKGECFTIAETMYEFVTEIPGEKQKESPDTSESASSDK